MPTTRHRVEDTPQDTVQPFTFPQTSHLLITTSRHIFAWDATGVRTIFQSSRGGIVAAKEAKDGSGVLAVASSNVIVMHDTKRGSEESWGLNAPQEEVRHLEYSPDAKTLFLTTTSDGTVHRYSTERSRLIDPSQSHQNAPVALAVSPTGHLVLSASQTPPVVYLKNVTHNSPPLQLQPVASAAPVSCVAFHPERPNVFLLAFHDGTLAAYDAIRIPRNERAVFADQQNANIGEIAHLQKLHRAGVSAEGTSERSILAAPVVGAAFLPGFKTRAVTVGRDGRCKLIDFAKGGVTLRTWHAKAPVTSIAVLALKKDDMHQADDLCQGASRRRKSGPHLMGGPTSTNSVIAISRIDGKVQLYDSVGLLLDRKTVSSLEENILSLEWCRGPSPRPFASHRGARRFSDANSVCIDQSTTPEAKALSRDESSRKKSRKSQPKPCDPLGPSRHLQTQPLPTRPLAVHPDEEAQQLETVRYTPASRKARIGPMLDARYEDLFSPLRYTQTQGPDLVQQRIGSPPRSRPRISSQTFIQCPAGASQQSPVAGQAKDAARPTTTKRLKVDHRRDTDNRHTKQTRRVSAGRPLKTNGERDFPFAHVVDGPTITRKQPSADVSTSNAKILADLRRFARGSSAGGGSRALSTYAAAPDRHAITKPRIPPKSSRRRLSARPQPVLEVDVDDPSTWPEDSASLSTCCQPHREDDIWLTSESEDDRSQHRQRRMKPLMRPPGRQNCRSKVDSRGTVSTTTAQEQSVPAVAPTQRRAVDGSTEEMTTAQSQISPDAEFFPVSEDVRELFPRSSSLSPHKKSGTKRNVQKPVARRDRTLTSMAVNASFGRPRKDPWTRVKSRKGARDAEVQVWEDPPVQSSNVPNDEASTCVACPQVNPRVRALEDEVARLRAEVIALKTVLRRNGLTLPAGLR